MMIEIQHMAHDINLELKSISRSETVHCFLPTQPGAGKFRRKEMGDEILKKNWKVEGHNATISRKRNGRGMIGEIEEEEA